MVQCIKDDDTDNGKFVKRVIECNGQPVQVQHPQQVKTTQTNDDEHITVVQYLNDAELRAKLKVPKLLKRHVDKVPTKMVPTNHGWEKVFMFKHPMPLEVVLLQNVLWCPRGVAQ